MTIYAQTDELTLHQGHVLDVLASLPAESVQCCVTSPPYWGLRDYGLPPSEWPGVVFSPMPGVPPGAAGLIPPWTGCLGREPEPMAFVGHLVAIFREVRRVLRPDGTCWVNLGDSFAGGAGGGRGDGAHRADGRQGGMSSKHDGKRIQHRCAELPSKSLLGIPWRVAFALQADGWWLRMDNVWAKPNPMPESVQDRCTKAHEYFFHLAKSAEYFYDRKAVEEPALNAGRVLDYTGDQKNNMVDPVMQRTRINGRKVTVKDTRNKRSVWTVASEPYAGAHFATMPPKLAQVPILAGSRPGDLVLDPFNGSGTTGEVALKLGRRYVGVELNPEFCRLAVERWRGRAGQRPLLFDGGRGE